ncbi:hypothetical protein HK096_006510 [Nowakowskiella sp. JEL0078]|nr:hypothetical protein HK096_006510 [Nowakowskiella sp. JEL0078]
MARETGANDSASQQIQRVAKLLDGGRVACPAVFFLTVIVPQSSWPSLQPSLCRSFPKVWLRSFCFLLLTGFACFIRLCRHHIRHCRNVCFHVCAFLVAACLILCCSYPWELLKELFRHKIILCLICSLAQNTSLFTLEYDQPQSDESLDDYITSIASLLDDLSDTPFTLQRLAELTIDPFAHYKSVYKYVRAVEKVLSLSPVPYSTLMEGVIMTELPELPPSPSLSASPYFSNSVSEAGFIPPITLNSMSTNQ